MNRLAALVLLPLTLAAAPTPAPAPQYHIYAGNTHAHTSFTWSHGDQWENAAKGKSATQPGLEVLPDGSQLPPKSKVLKPDWERFQGPPAAHFKLAKEAGYDFYCTTDHSQEADLQPPSPTNPKWLATTRAAADATDEHFVAIAGYEHSENNGPGGTGHLNVLNSSAYLNALAPGVTLPSFYRWLKTVQPNGDGPVVASFNHPGVHQYNDWAYRDPEVTDVITMLEVINSNNKIHYPAFIAALDHGWRVSPVCGNDNHGFWGITHHTSRTFVLATELTKPALLEAMKHRRTYASLDPRLNCQYTANDAVMGSVLPATTTALHVTLSAEDPQDKITKVDFITDHGKVVQTFDAPDFPLSTTFDVPTAHYVFPRVYTSRHSPAAWLAPVWIDR